MTRKHILVVDDDVAHLSLLKMRLESNGQTVGTAQHGWEGLIKLEYEDYDVVLLDCMMPGMTGLTVLQYIQERHPSVPVVMMTHHLSSQVAAQALAAGSTGLPGQTRGPCGVAAGSAVLCRNGRVRAIEAGYRTKSRKTRQVTNR